jgi:hypothetical protein
VTEVVVQGTIKPGGTLEVSQPINLPPGEVRVIVQAVGSNREKERPLTVLHRIWAQRKSLGVQGRTKKHIDADIQSMRDEWEERQRDLGRIQDEARRAREHPSC